MRRILAATAMLLLLSGLPAQAAETAAAVVTEFHEKLLGAARQTPPEAVKQRYDALAPAVDSAFHLEMTARQSAGRSAWNAATEPQRKAMVAAFRHWTVATYANQFKGLNDSSFTTVGEKPGPRQDMVLVETLLKDTGSEPVSLTYLMVRNGGRWGVYDVIVKQGATAISQLAKYISEFSAIVRDGLPALTQALDGKARGLLGS